jgi:hypothetical protein
MEQEESQGSGTGWLLFLILLGAVCWYVMQGMPSTSVVDTSSSSCDTVASGYTQQGWAREACQDALDAGIPGQYFARQIYQESGFNPNVVSSTGDIGIAQFQMATARGLGVDPYEPHGALRGAAQLMGRYYQQYGDYAKALGAYNSGSGTLASAVRRCGMSWKTCLPVVTQHYINVIMG